LTFLHAVLQEETESKTNFKKIAVDSVKIKNHAKNVCEKCTNSIQSECSAQLFEAEVRIQIVLKIIAT